MAKAAVYLGNISLFKVAVHTYIWMQNQTPDGFTAQVILRAENPKTKEIITLPPIRLPATHKNLTFQATAPEARQFAATYALFRVCSMRNIHMTLPPNYRDVWKGDFQELKNEDVKNGRGWMYESNPFAAKQEREEAQALMAKKREEREKQLAKEAEKPSGPGPSNTSGGSRNVMRGWTRVPKIDMGKRTRAKVENFIRENTVWNAHRVAISDFHRRNIINELTGLGFRKSHIEEAIAECKDKEEVLEWLLIHVPEDDLPSWSLPEGYAAGISMATGNMKREASIKRLSESGYAVEVCESTLDDCRGDEVKAAEVLQDLLVQGARTSQLEGVHISSLSIIPDDGLTSTWEEERDTLESIFGSRFNRSASNIYQINLEIPQSAVHMLHARKSRSYPKTAPIISVTSPGLPAYIRLSIIRKAIEHCNDNLLEQPMIFNLVDWLEAEIPRIVENPGKLREISAGASAVGENTELVKDTKKIQRRISPSVDWRLGNPRSIAILEHWEARQKSAQQQKMLAGRRSLPAWALREFIVDTVNRHQVTIISGETGSGKSTQSVQFVLDDMIQRKLGSAANIICTQPRRISALGLADRVSDERCSEVGEEVGYAIRGESKQKPGVTKITFVTTGVLLRRLQTSGGSTEDVTATLADVSHVVVDEVHERSLDTDILLVLLREVLSKRKDFKVVLMSATLDAGVFERYFSSMSSVGKVEIQGRTFPVDDYYLDDIVRMTGFNPGSRSVNVDIEEDADLEPSIANAIQNIGMQINYNLIANAVRAIDAELGSIEGGILIFLPGTMEINRALEAIKSIPNIYALPLHASLMSSEQRRVFPPAPKGQRKVIAATNVAETSITIEDIIAVIDTGKAKETSFDAQNNMVRLEEVWASRAACKQRRGRAGRVRAGKCYKLYTRNAEAKMAERPEPEIRRVPLEQLCLSVRAMGIKDVSTFLASALTPPESMAVDNAIDLLGRMGALDGDRLTALGQHLAMIPADLRCGKLMVYGATFGCLEASLTISAILTVKTPFVSPQTKREESKAARSSFAQGQGDLLGDLRAYEKWSELRRASTYRDMRTWCEQRYLSSQTLTDISSNRSQYLSSLKEAGFLPPNYHSSTPSLLNAHNDNPALIRALIAGAFNPQLARIELPDKKFTASISGAVELDPEAKTIKYFNQDNGRVFIHPSSTLFDAQGFPSNAVYMSYFSKMATSKVFIRELTPFNAYTLLLFGSAPQIDTLGRGLTVDNWLRLRGWARIGVLVSRLRSMLDDVLAKKIENPSGELGKVGEEVVGVVRKLVELDGLDR